MQLIFLGKLQFSEGKIIKRALVKSRGTTLVPVYDIIQVIFVNFLKKIIFFIFFLFLVH